jgi:hypothetical protein
MDTITNNGSAGARSLNSASDDRTSNNTVRHAYRVLSEQEKAQMLSIKNAGREFLELIDVVAIGGRGHSRELSIAKTKIEEAVMWAVKHVTA